MQQINYYNYFIFIVTVTQKDEDIVFFQKLSLQLKQSILGIT